MDPNANMREQLELARKIVADFGDGEDAWHVANAPDLVEPAARLAELVLALDEWRSKGGFDPYGDPAADNLLAIHKMLFPERYPRADQPDHAFWDDHDESDCVDTPEMGRAVFEWSSETIEWVVEMLEPALAGDPRAKLKP